MDFFTFKNVQIYLLIITMLLSTTTAAPFFGVDLPAPKKSGGGEISPPNPWLSSNSQKSSPFGSTNPNPGPFGNPFPSVDNSNNSPSGNFFNPSPMEFIDTVKTVPEKSIELISTLAQKITENEPIPEEELGWSDTGSDYTTTETSEYESTTEDLDHIGAPAPAVVASLLG